LATYWQPYLIFVVLFLLSQFILHQQLAITSQPHFMGKGEPDVWKTREWGWVGS